ncbi:MAG TPA: toxin-antitoxin system, antitoxin component [Spirochaetia bacterium]|nr:toxin-antitoxin system, antitoxin component [Spirochaetia bacterium]
MPQLSRYIDEETLHKLETAAKLENVSISKYVVRKLNETMSTSWPEGYHKLFGSISDSSFDIASPKDFAADSSREAL